MGRPLTPDECRANARECYRLAKTIIEPELKRLLLDLMVQWRQLAGRIERIVLH
jgi:hypothetical protein